jgi:ATP-binding cassette subfamily B protein
MPRMGWWTYLHYDEKRDKPRVTWDLIRRVLSYARPYRLKIGIVLATIILSSLLGLVTPLLFRSLIDNALPNKDVRLLDALALGIVAIPVLNGVIAVFQRFLNASIGEGVIYELRVAIFAHLQRMSIRFFTNTKTGELMSRLNNDVVGAQSAISSTIVGIITNVVSVIATLIIMLALEWRLTLLGLLVVPLFVIPARRVGKALRDIARAQMDVNASMNAMINETLNVSGALLVKLFGRTNEEVDRFSGRAGSVRDLGVRRTIIGTQLFVGLGLISTVGTALVYWIGGHLALDGVFSTGLIVAFGLYLTQIYGPLQSLVNAPVEFATSMVSFERVFEVLDMPVEIKEKANAIPLSNVRGEVVFDQVSFSYAETEEQGRLTEVERAGRIDNVRAVLSGDKAGKANATAPAGVSHASPLQNDNEDIVDVVPDSQARPIAIDDVTFTLKPGQLAALIGPSGAGKTTITYLLPRLYDPTAGRILIDGHDLRDISLNSLAETIGMVTQETYLFHDTIRTNLLYARPNATQDEIEAAARAANIHNFIAGLSEGYDTIVGERGYRLSGGEKQRIAIARVILKDPRILVLDEATSHLDSQSEALIQSALETVMKGRTSLVIAHRLSTILAADVILVLDRGRVVERGTHAELLAQNGLYATLYETQFNRERMAL